MSLIQFDVVSGQRISDAVQYVEGVANRRKPLNAQAVFEQSKTKAVRICTFTGAWAIGSAKIVTFKNHPNTPNTVSATNLFFPIGTAPSSIKDCAIAKDGTAWYLIDVPLRTETAVFVTGTQNQDLVFAITTASQSILTDMQLSASLNTQNCTITIGKTSTTQNVSVVSGFSTARITVISKTATGSYLRVDI